MSKLFQISPYKFHLLGASAAAMVMGCSPLHIYEDSAAIYESHGYAPTAQSQYDISHIQPPRVRNSLFQGHALDTHTLNPPARPSAPIQWIASANTAPINPYVPPSANARRFISANPAPHNIGVPSLRPRFQHNLDSSVVLAPKAAPTIAPKAILPSANTPALPTQLVMPSKPNAYQSAGIGRFETAQPTTADLPIPPLPDAQKHTIQTEQKSLVGIQDKEIIAGPVSLRQSLDSAFARSSRLAAETLRVDEAQEVLKQAKAQSKPRLELRSIVGPRTSETTFAFSNTTVNATTIRRSAELDLSLPIYQGGRLRAQRSSAEIGIETARAAVAQTRSEIIEQTAIAYLDVVRDRKLVQLYQKNVDLLEQQQSSIAELLTLNESTISEKALVDARLATQRIRLETGLGVLRESEAHYKNLVGSPAPATLPVPIFNLPLSLVEVQALAQQNSPELTALINRAKSAEFDVDIAKSNTRPSLALQGVVRGAEGQSETINRNAAAELLLNFRMPLSTGGEGKSRIRQAKLIRNRLNLEIRDTQDQLRDQIDRLWARKLASEKSKAFNQTQITATEFAVQTVAEQRAEGVATILDLLNVQQTLLDAQIQTVEAQSLQDTASVQLLNLMGVYQ